ncbi:hypothetical protein [uncultured Paludibaculum sp.]|uniref:hypothetical protein n=1 Tax=uncultured Paludibaculum sp. TaxID=1765020 RepID=UPI002AAB4F18|nr:hypothetical protein [uncultured Paludibaculum sp.]
MKLVTLLLLGGCLSLVQAQNPYVFFSPQAVVLSADAGTGAKVSAPVRMITTGPGFKFSVQGNQGWMVVTQPGAPRLQPL